MIFDIARINYISLWKVYNLSSGRGLENRTTEVSANFRIFGNSNFGYKQSKSLEGDNAPSKDILLRRAPSIIRSISKKSSPIEREDNPQIGEWRSLRGNFATALRTHDDFRGSESKDAPRIAIWATNILNDDGTATLILLHGTADGNLQSLSQNSLPEDRSGSNSELLFEHLWSLSRSKKLDRDYDFSKTEETLVNCLSIIGSENECNSGFFETLFQIHYSKSVSQEIRHRSLISNISGGQSFPIVSHLIIGTPLVVQTLTRRPRSPLKRIIGNFFNK